MKTASLLAALNSAKPALGSGERAVPILSHFCFDDDNLYAYNDTAAVIVNEKTGLTCGLHGDTLLGILSVGPADGEVAVKPGDGFVQIDTGSGWVKVPSLPPDAFIFKLPDEEPQIKLALTGEVAIGIERCLISVSEATIKPELCGVTVVVNKAGITLYGSDNVTACRFRPQAKQVGRKTYAAVLPAAFCTLLLKLKLRTQDEKPVLALGTRAAIIQCGEVTLVSRLLEAKPDVFASVFAAHADSAVFLPVPDGLRDELSRAAVLLGRESIKQCSITCTSSTSKKAEITATGSLGTMQTQVVTELQGTVKFDPEHALRVLPHADGIAINDGRSMVFRGGDTLTYIIASANTSAE